ncbi:hypothetical protein ACLMNJ_16465 [Streptomyces seoulensis]
MTDVPVPALDTVRTLAAFVKARTEEGAQRLAERLPAGQRGTADAAELLRIPAALGQAAKLAAHGLERELAGEQPDDEAVRLLWRTLLNTAQPFHAHPALPAAARGALPAAGPV